MMFEQFLSRSACIASSRNSVYKSKQKVSTPQTFYFKNTLQKQPSQKAKTPKILISQHPYNSQLHKVQRRKRLSLLQKNFASFKTDSTTKIIKTKQSKKQKSQQCCCKCFDEFDKRIKAKQNQLKLIQKQLANRIQRLQIVESRNKQFQQNYEIQIKELEEGRQKLQKYAQEIQNRLNTIQQQNKAERFNILKQKQALMKRNCDLDDKQIYLEALSQNLKNYQFQVRKALTDIKASKFNIQANNNNMVSSKSKNEYFRNNQMLDKLLFGQNSLQQNILNDSINQQSLLI